MRKYQKEALELISTVTELQVPVRGPTADWVEPKRGP